MLPNWRFLEERPANRVEALPMALWGLNDLPGAVTPYSPHRVVFGRDPPWFGNTPPMEDWQGPEDALQFFERVSGSIPRFQNSFISCIKLREKNLRDNVPS